MHAHHPSFSTHILTSIHRFVVAEKALSQCEHALDVCVRYVCALQANVDTQRLSQRVSADRKRVCTHDVNQTEQSQWIFSPLAKSVEPSVSQCRRASRWKRRRMTSQCHQHQQQGIIITRFALRMARSHLSLPYLYPASSVRIQWIRDCISGTAHTIHTFSGIVIEVAWLPACIQLLCFIFVPHSEPVGARASVCDVRMLVCSRVLCKYMIYIYVYTIYLNNIWIILCKQRYFLIKCARQKFIISSFCECALVVVVAVAVLMAAKMGCES